MMLYDAQKVQFDVHNLNPSMGTLQFTKNDTMSGPVLYSDSVFLGPAGGVLRKGIIYNTELTRNLNADTSSSSVLCLNQSQTGAR